MSCTIVFKLIPAYGVVIFCLGLPPFFLYAEESVCKQYTFLFLLIQAILLDYTPQMSSSRFSVVPVINDASECCKQSSLPSPA